MNYLKKTVPDNYHKDLEEAREDYPLMGDPDDEVPWKWNWNTDLDSAFSWEHTPQGFEFWAELNGRIK